MYVLADHDQSGKCIYERCVEQERYSCVLRGILCKALLNGKCKCKWVKRNRKLGCGGMEGEWRVGKVGQMEA